MAHAPSRTRHIQEERLEALWATPKTIWGELTTVDHKKLGKRYLVTAIVFLILGGIEALVLRAQLAQSDLHLLSPEAYDQMFTLHGTTMIWWYAAPILSGFSIFVIPMMIGARDMALPRLNAFSYWTFLFSGVFLYTSLLIGQAPHGGWFAYVPYTSARYSPGYHMEFYIFSLILLTISTTAGAINFLVTIFHHRAPGMSLNRMPLMAYSTATMSLLSVVALPSLTACLCLLYLDRNWGFHFFDASHGGSVLLWQHLFWFFGHPWVYIVFLPATGMMSMIIPVHSRRPVVGYTWIAAATVVTGVVGMGVWVHHMFATGMNYLAMSFFSAASITISLLTTIQVFAWLATLYLGKPVVNAPMRFAMGFVALIIIGGLNGVVTALIPWDWQLTDTYFVVSHLHYVLIGANLFPVMAAFYHWLPKMTGRMMNERLAFYSFWLMFIGINVAFFPMQILGALGMPRRIYTYSPEYGWDALNMIVTIGAFVFAVGFFISVLNFLYSMKSGEPAGPDPWGADSLEWDVESPPPEYGARRIPTVASRHPLWDDHDEHEDPLDLRRLDHGRYTLATSWLDARPIAVSKMPGDSIWPLATSLLLLVICYLMLFNLIWIALGTAIVFGLASGVWLWPKKEKAAP